MIMPDNTQFVKVENPSMVPDRTKNQRLPMAERLTTFNEVEKTYTEDEAQREAARCLGCPSRWCSKECPAGMPVPDFIRAIRAGDYAEAYRWISSASPLPEFCSRLCPQEKQCQSNCTRSIRSDAVGIGKLERFVAEQHYASGVPEKAAPATGKNVAVVGSGPSGLSAACFLAKMGHTVTVYERDAQPGGLLRYGIPNMKLDKKTLDRKLDAMQDQGITFVTGASNIVPADLQTQYDAVILAVGTGNARSISIEGAEHAVGIIKAVDYLSGSEDASGRPVIILGGGDTGNDCVGTAIRQGAASITQIELLPQSTGVQHIVDPVYAKPRDQKFDASQEEHLNKFLRDPHIYQATVKAVQTDASGRLQQAVVVHMEPTWDENRRLVMREIPGSEEVLECQLLVVAAGFIGPEPSVAELFQVETTGRSNIADHNYQTSQPGIFACGDCRTGQSLVVKAMVDGRACARAVDEFITR